MQLTARRNFELLKANPRNPSLHFRNSGNTGRGYMARAVGYSIHTHSDDQQDLKFLLREAVLCHSDDGEAPQAIWVHLVHDEVIRVRECPGTSQRYYNRVCADA